MLRHLERIGIIQELEFNPLTYKITEITRSTLKVLHSSDNEDVIYSYIIKFINYLSNKGLLVKPFLKAVRDGLNKTGLIKNKIRDYSIEEGVYNLTCNDTIYLSAMRNFLFLFGLIKYKKKKYELTNLGLKITEEREVIDRARCSREFCREVCPSNAILSYEISGCVGCGLCIKACPYGAITFQIEDPTKPIFNSDICLKEKGQQRYASPQKFNYILSEEHIMQKWIKAVFRFTNLNAEIPGIVQFLE